MSYEIYRYIFIIAAILCGVMVIASILVFIILNIPKVISDLSGATARKAIKNIRDQNEKTGDKSHKVSTVNRDRGKLTDKISPSGNIIQRSQTQMGLGIETSKIATQHLQPESADSQTTVLDAYNETSVLSTDFGENQTTVLDSHEEMQSFNANEGAGQTTILSNTEVVPETTILDTSVPAAVEPTFAIEYDITFIHTNEIIETEVVQ